MALEPITTSGPTITVTTPDELKDAYNLFSNQAGGGTILMEGGEYGTLWIYEYGGTDGDQPVVIASADPTDPAEFSRLHIRDATNIRFENILVDSTGSTRDASIVDVYVQNSSNIQFVDSVFQHDTDNVLKDAGEPVEKMGVVRESDNILFEGNYIEGYFHGPEIINSEFVEIIGNEITQIQGDGIRGGGLQDTLIADNYLHDFYGIDQIYTHSDLIQIWGTNSTQITKNLTITGNTLMTTDSASQSIFIRNGEFGQDTSATSGYFENITITDNLIYNGHLHGVYVADADGVLIDNNTLLWNPDAYLGVGETSTNSIPQIVVKNVLNTDITDNITYGIKATGGTQDGNVFVTYGNPGETSYVGNHFINPLAGFEITTGDLSMLTTSPWYGEKGSSIGTEPVDISDGAVAIISASWVDGDQYDMIFDASQSFDASGLTTETAGYTYHWTFDDGTTAEGLTVSKLYDNGGFKGVALEIRLDGEPVAASVRNFAVETKDIFAFDFEDGVVDISDGLPEFDNKGTTISDGGDTGFLIGDGNKLDFTRGTEEIYNLEKFGLAMDLQPTGDEPAGTFLYLNEAMEGKVLDDGRFSFSLTTDEGTFSLTSTTSVFADGESHRIGIGYDGTTGQLELFADGESVSSTEAWGKTAAPYYNLTIGNTWRDSMDAIIDDLVMSVDPAVAGDLPDIAPPQDPPAEDPPAEDPPAEDPPAEEPPAEDPPAEEPPAEDPGGRGEEREPVASDGGSDFFLADLLDIILSLFGLGSDDDPRPVSTVETTESAKVMLSDVLPVTEALDEDMPIEEDEETEIDLAA